MKIIYTETGQKELKKFLDEQTQLLEEFIRDEKAIFGDTELEITGADINKIKPSLKPILLKKKKTIRIEVLCYLYIYMGILCIIGGFIYPYLRFLFYSNVNQAIVITVGVLFIMCGLSSLFFFRIRSNRYFINKCNNAIQNYKKDFKENEDKH